MDEPIVFHCPRPHCETCIHQDCPGYLDEIKLCGFLLKCGIDFSKIVEHEGNGGVEN